MPRFLLLTFLRFLGLFFIFSEIFASGVLYFLLVCEPGHRKLSFTLSDKEICKENFEVMYVQVKDVSKVSKLEKKISRSLSSEISMLRRS